MTRTKWAKLSPEEQHLKIAELCGWSKFEPLDWAIDDTSLMGLFTHRGRKNKEGWGLVPDYLNDLNAINDALQAISHEQLCDYPHALGKVLFGNYTNRNDWVVHTMLIATAAQRTEALVFTLEPE